MTAAPTPILCSSWDEKFQPSILKLNSIYRWPVDFAAFGILEQLLVNVKLLLASSRKIVNSF